MSTRDLDCPPQPTSELPPFVFVPEPRRQHPTVRAARRHRAAAGRATRHPGAGAPGTRWPPPWWPWVCSRPAESAWAARDATGPATVGPAAGQLPPGAAGQPRPAARSAARHAARPGARGTPDDDGAAHT